MREVSSRLFFTRVLMTSLILVLVLGAGIDYYRVANGTQNWIGKFTLTWGAVLILLMVFGMIASIWGVIIIWKPRSFQTLQIKLSAARDQLRYLSWLLAGIIAFVPAKIFLYTPIGFLLGSVYFRLSIFITIVLLMSFLFSGANKRLFTFNGVLASIIVLGCVFAFAKEFVNVVDYPFSLTWSEGNRIWDYSVLYGRDLYNYPQNLPIKAYIDRGRQGLWGLPFLIPGITIQGVRLWSAIIYTIPYAVLGWMSFRPLPKFRKQWFILGLWSFLFIYQGPVYTPIILSGTIIAAVRKRPFWISIPLIFIAGYYAQMSRITWMIAPISWSIMISLFGDSEMDAGRFLKNQWLKIFLFGLSGFFGGVGLTRGWSKITGYLSKSIGTLPGDVRSESSGLPPIEFSDTYELIGQNTMLTDQTLLWERLWPNPTYGVGIILGLVIAVVPLLILLIYLHVSKKWELNVIQKWSLLSILIGLMGVGIVISTKIGGGGDLHNLDMFLISLVLTAGLAWEYGGYKLFNQKAILSPGIKVISLLVVGIPAFTPWIGAKPLELPPEDKIQWTLDLLKSVTAEVVEAGGEILFMDQRQLLTFGYLGDIPLVPEYEKKLVMDRAMSGNFSYFQTFYKDISNQRFAMIITEPQRIRYADDMEGWGMENDTWVEWVTKPLLCYYEPKHAIKATGVWFLAPRENPGNCDYP